MQEVVIAVISSVFSATILLLIKGFVKSVNRKLTIVLQEIELTRIDVNAMDYAVEQSLPKNGYTDYRTAKKDELLKNSRFINQ